MLLMKLILLCFTCLISTLSLKSRGDGYSPSDFHDFIAQINRDIDNREIHISQLSKLPPVNAGRIFPAEFRWVNVGPFPQSQRLCAHASFAVTYPPGSTPYFIFTFFSLDSQQISPVGVFAQAKHITQNDFWLCLEGPEHVLISPSFFVDWTSFQNPPQET